MRVLARMSARRSVYLTAHVLLYWLTHQRRAPSSSGSQLLVLKLALACHLALATPTSACRLLPMAPHLTPVELSGQGREPGRAWDGAGAWAWEERGSGVGGGAGRGAGRARDVVRGAG